MIELKSLQKVIDQKTVIDIDALSVRAGEITALVGPVDSGKDTLFELLTGQSRPTVGEVRLAGVDPFVEKERFSRQVGVLFSEDSLYKRRSAHGNLKFYCRLWRLPKSRVVEVLAQVGLADHADTRVENLPPGLVRRLAFWSCDFAQSHGTPVGRAFYKMRPIFDFFVEQLDAPVGW